MSLTSYCCCPNHDGWYRDGVLLSRSSNRDDGYSFIVINDIESVEREIVTSELVEYYVQNNNYLIEFELNSKVEFNPPVFHQKPHLHTKPMTMQHVALYK